MAKKQGLGAFRPKLISVAVASCFVAGAAFANPTGPKVVNGTATFEQIGNLLKVTNSPSAIINWQSFSIGVNEITRFIQQSQASAVLNRVTGQAGTIDPSVILGALQSNGRVLLINPSGIVFGAGAQVDVAGLVASSLNLSDQDFLANRLRFTETAGAGAVANHGSINTGAGGAVYLVGPAVTNGGIITSPQGEVVLAAGQTVELVDAGTPNLRVEITAPENQAVNLGSIVAESGRVGIHAGLINNSGTVSASSAVAEGGRILLKATKAVTLESSSILDASGAGGGTIEVLAKDGGTVNVAGRLDASAPVSGDGGFIETSADNVRIDPGTVATTAAANGATGTYLIDPTDFFISYGGAAQSPSGIGADTLVSMLNTNVMVIETSAAGSYAGNITVGADVSWSSEHSLTLRAHEDIYVNNTINNAGTGDINLFAGWNGDSGSAVVNNSNGDIQVAAPISTQGNVRLSAGGHAHQIAGYGGSITANQLLIESLGTSANFDDAVNSVNTLAGRSVQGFFFNNDKSLTIGTVGGVSGITVNAAPFQSSSVDINVDGATAAATLNVNSNIIATSGASYGANIDLNAGLNSSYGGTINVTNATVQANGGPGSGFSSGGDANVSFEATNGVAVTGSVVRAQGGTGAYGGGWSSVDIYAGNGTLGVTGGSTVEALGGNATEPGNSGGNGWIYLSSGSLATVNVTGSTVRARGGTGTYAGSGDVQIYDNVANANITNSTIEADGAEGGIDVYAGNDLTVSGSTLKANGRAGESGGYAQIDLYAEGDLAVSGSSLLATAGNGTAYGGGYASVDIESQAGTVGITNGSTLEALGGAGAAGYNGGSAYVDVYAGGGPQTINISGSTVRAIGGAGGSGSTAGSGDIWIYDEAGSVSIANSTLRADGSEGGIDIDAANNLNISGSTLNAVGRTGPWGGFAYIWTNSDNDTTITNSSLVSTGGNATAPDNFGGDASVDVHSNGSGNSSLTVQGSTLQATAGAGTTAALRARADVHLAADSGGVLIENSTAKADGREAWLGVDASTNVVANGSSLSAMGRTGADGGEGFTGVFASEGSVNTGSSTLSAVGRTSADGCCGSGVAVDAGGNVTLGLVNSNEFASIFSGGAIVDGNAGGNVIAPFATLQANNGIGSIANPLETATGSLYVDTYGGEVGIINSGNLLLQNLFNGGSGANAIGTTGTMLFNNPVETSGNLTLLASNGMVVQQNIFTNGDLLMSGGGGTLAFDGINVFGNNVTLAGNTVQVGFLDTSTAGTTVAASNLMKVTTAGNLNVLGGANSGANALLAGTDVDLTVGTVSGFVNIHGGSNGASAQISAGSPTTIHLFFPTLSTGGYFVNGVQGAITDGNTGFFAGGEPAILGQNLIVTYGATELPPLVQQAVNQVIDSTDDDDKKKPENYVAGSGETTDEETKELPVCQ